MNIRKEQYDSISNFETPDLIQISYSAIPHLIQFSNFDY